MSETQAFDVDLAALLRVFGGHLYSTPAVFARELVQNALDAVALRAEAGAFDAEIVVTVEPGAGVVRFTDNGIGLDAEGLREHLSRVGASSKRTVDRKKVVGQFGIGLLSAFLVADEIVVRTCTAGGAPLVWRAGADGKYVIEGGDRASQGTEVVVTLRADARGFADEARMRELLSTYVPHVTTPVRLRSGDREEVVTRPGIWALGGEAHRAALDELAGAPPIATLDVRTDAAEGTLWIRAEATTLTQPTLCLYHHGILVDATASGLLPRWAGFVGGILNAPALAPTASREGFVRDAAWDALKAHLSSRLIGMLANLPHADPRAMAAVLETHRAHVLAACVDDRALLAACGGQIPFAANGGLVTLDELVARSSSDVLYTTSSSDFALAAPITMARDLALIDATHTHESEFLAAWQRATSRPRLRELVLAEIEAWIVDAPEQRMRFASLLGEAAKLLAPFMVKPELKSFDPSEVPAILLEDAQNLRARAAEVANTGNALQRSLVGGLSIARRAPLTPLVLNVQNPLVASLPELVAPEIGARVVRMLYVQAAQRLRRAPSLVDNRSFAIDMLHILRAASEPDDHGSITRH